MRNGPVIKIGPGEEFPKDTPAQYIKGWVEFYKLKFKVTPDVLIPRPETELLVDEVIHFYTLYPKPYTLIDLGTGCGNLAISIAKNAKFVKIFATDISEAALEVAKENAKKHRVDKRIFFLKSDLLFDLNYTLYPIPYLSKGKASSAYTLIIVTNLPYIPTSRIDYLDPSVKDFEPRVALDGGPDGFELYRKLFQQINQKFIPNPRGSKPFNPGGWIRSNPGRSLGSLKLVICEIDYTQGEIAVLEAQKYFPKAKVEVKTDLAKKQRILVIQF